MGWNKLAEVLQKKETFPKYVKGVDEDKGWVILEVLSVNATDDHAIANCTVEVAQGEVKLEKISWESLVGTITMAKGSRFWMKGYFWEDDKWEVLDATCPECDGPLLAPPDEYICVKCGG
jgi:ribosomal protein S27AE